MAAGICEIATSLEQQGHRVIKIGSAKELVDKLAAGQRFDVVFHCCSKTDSARMATQIPALLSIYDVNCVTIDDAQAVHARISETLAHHQPRKPHVQSVAQPKNLKTKVTAQ